MTYYGIGIDTNWLYSLDNTDQADKVGARLKKLKPVGTAAQKFHNYTVLLWNKRIDAECAKMVLTREGYPMYSVTLRVEGGNIKNDY